jgi:SRSO17 transposase
VNDTHVPQAGPLPLPEVAAYLAPFRSLFRYRPSWESVERYVTGLLTDLGRKNCEVLAATLAGTSVERLQHLLTDASWDPVALDEARVRRLVAGSPAGGVLVLDDTGLPKQGKASAGVARQYSGTLGKKGNCQVLVSAEYVEDRLERSDPLHWPVSAQLYLPESWTDDPARCRRAHVPAAIRFLTKPELAIGLVDRARAWGVLFSVVVADSGYGDNPSFLAELEARALPYVCAVERSFGVRLPAEVAAVQAAGPPPYQGQGQPRKARPAPLYTVEAISARQPADAWCSVSWRQGSTGAPLGCQVVAVRVHRATGRSALSVDDRRVTTGPEGWLIGERPLPGEDGKAKWYFSTLPADTPWERLIALAHQRWVVEQFYEDAKGECGLDDYQGRRWDGLHRHVALSMLAYSFLVYHRLSLSAAGGFPPLSTATKPAGSPSRHPALALPGRRPLAHHDRPHQDLSPTKELTK